MVVVVVRVTSPQGSTVKPRRVANETSHSQDIQTIERIQGPILLHLIF